MTICFIVEGGYPYIKGGVSSWIDSLIRSMPSYDFKLISIMPSINLRPKIQVKIPENLIEIKTFFLDEKVAEKPIFPSPTLEEDIIENIYNFLKFTKDFNVKEFEKEFFKNRSLGNTNGFIESELFWDNIIKIYQEDFPQAIFNNYIWSRKEMIFPLLSLMEAELIEADIYHCASTGYAGILGLIHKHRYDKPLILSEHGIYTKEREEDILKANWIDNNFKGMWIDFFSFLSRLVYKEADIVTSLFKEIQNFQISSSVSEERSRLIPNGVNFSSFENIPLRKDAKNLCAALRITPIKDVLTMIRAFAILNSELKDTKLYLMGPTDEDKTYFNKCKDIVNVLGLEDSVIFTGNIDLRTYFPMMDIILFSSISEGQPIALLEGLASGLPAITTDVGDCKNILLEDGQCGFVVDPFSPDQMAAKMKVLIEDFELRKHFSTNALRKAEKKYDFDKIISSYKKLYEEVI